MVLTDSTYSTSNAVQKDGAAGAGTMPMKNFAVGIENNENTQNSNLPTSTTLKKGTSSNKSSRFSKANKKKRTNKGAPAPLKQSSRSNISVLISPSKMAKRGASFLMNRLSPRNSPKALAGSAGNAKLTPIEQLLEAQEKEAKVVKLLGIVPSGKDGKLSRKQRAKVRAHLAKEEKAAAATKTATSSTIASTTTTSKKRKNKRSNRSKKNKAVVVPSTKKDESAAVPSPSNSILAKKEDMVLDSSNTKDPESGDNKPRDILEIISSFDHESTGPTLFMDDNAVNQTPVQETGKAVSYSPRLLEMEVVVGSDQQQRGVLNDPYFDDNDGKKVDACGRLFLPVSSFFKSLFVTSS